MFSNIFPIIIARISKKHTMKKIILASGLALFAVSTFAQNILTETNGRVTVRNTNDSVITQVDPIGSGAINASFNADKTEIVVVYSNGNVVVKSIAGATIVRLADSNTDKAVAAVWSGENVIITTQSNATISKNSSEWEQLIKSTNIH